MLKLTISTLFGLVCAAPGLPPSASAPTAAAPKKQPLNAVPLLGAIKEDTSDRKFHHRPPTLLCIEGFILNQANNRCEKVDVVSAAVGCPDGWMLTDGVCKTNHVEPAKLGCPPDYERTNDGCVRIYDAPMNLLCPAYYVATPTGCVKHVETEPTWACEKGKPNGSICEYSKLSQETVICPEGYDQVDDKCVRKRSVGATLACPLGYELDEDAKKCFKMLEMPPIQNCNDGTITADGVCIGSSIIPVPSVCPRGTVEDQGRCRKLISQDAAAMCPSGTEEAGEVCIKEEQQPVKLVCPLSNAKPTVAGTCPSKEPPVKQCPGGWTFKDKKGCVKRSIVRKELICPIGMKLLGNHCAANEYAYPRRECPEGAKRLNNDECVLETRKEIDLVCEPPYVLVDEVKCVFSAVIDAEHKCLQGFYDENAKNCTIAEALPLEKQCPEGARRILQGNEYICEEIMQEQAHAECPLDFKYKDGACRGTATLPGKVSCDPPFMERHGVCVIEEKRLIEPYCNDGILRGSSCIVDREQPPAVLCPETYTYETGGRLCKKLIWSLPELECERGWMYDTKVKECYRFEGEEPPSTPSGQTNPSGPSGSPTPSEANKDQEPRGEEPDEDKPGEESLLPMEVHPPTTTTTATVKARVQLPGTGKENFVPIQTFTGANAAAQAHQYEALKLAGAHAQAVYAPAVTSVNV